MFIVEIRKRRRIHKKRNDLFFSLFILCVRWNCDYLFVCWRWKRRVIDENEREKWGKKQQILESLVSCFSVEIESSGCGTNRKKIWWSFTSAHKTPLLKRYAQKKKLWCATTKKSEKDRLLLSKLRCMLFFSFLFCRVLLSRFGNNYSLLSVVIKFVRNHFRFANYGAKRCWYGCWRFFICNIMRCVCVSCAYFNWRQNLNLDTKSNEPKLIFKRRVLNNNNSSSQGKKVKFSACCVCECFFPFLFSFAFEVRWYIKMSAPSSVVANI